MGNRLAGFKKMPKSWVMFEELARGCIVTFSVEVPSGPFQLALPMRSLISTINILLHHAHLSCLSFTQFVTCKEQAAPLKRMGQTPVSGVNEVIL